MIRRGTLDDAAAAARLCSVVDPYMLITTRSLEYEMRTAPARAESAHWAAVEDGELVGWAFATRTYWSSAEDEAMCVVRVHPDNRGRGLGGALYEAVEQHLDSLAIKRVTTWSHDTDASRDFAERRGFEVIGSMTASGVDPRTIGELPEPEPGTVLVPFTEFDDNPEPIWRIDVEAGRDIPTDAPFDFDALELEEWLELIWRHPDHDLELGTVAIVDGEPASMTSVLSDRPTARAVTQMTGTHRAYRHRGLAQLVKQRSLQRAAQVGITLALTGNHAVNVAMLGINARLGYEPLESVVEWIRLR
jgi:GNAT superfamily N-acetyltransferase